MTFPFVRMAAMAFAAATIMGADAALAQATKPAAPAPGQAAGPVKLELVGLQPQWTKQCSKDQSGKEVCLTQREFGQVVDQPPTLIIAVYQIGEEHRFARFVLPLGFLLSPGVGCSPRRANRSRADLRSVCRKAVSRRLNSATQASTRSRSRVRRPSSCAIRRTPKSHSTSR